MRGRVALTAFLLFNCIIFILLNNMLNTLSYC